MTMIHKPHTFFHRYLMYNIYYNYYIALNLSILLDYLSSFQLGTIIATVFLE